MKLFQRSSDPSSPAVARAQQNVAMSLAKSKSGVPGGVGEKSRGRVGR